ncbi:MAG: hypothetical protein ACM3PE_12490 [Deltaproteobacteria bacterium]
MISLKVVGISLIISGFGGWGLAGARRMDRRLEEIRDLRIALGFLEKEITTMYTPLSLALQRTAEFSDIPVAYLFRDSAAALQLKQGVTVREAWNKGLHSIARESSLLPDDTKLLENAAGQLGMSNASEQKKVFALIQEELKLQEEKAREKVKANRQLWSYGGFIIGAVVVILLL